MWEPRTAGEQVGVLSNSNGESPQAGRPVGDEGMDWVTVVGKGQLQGPLAVGPLCVRPGSKRFTCLVSYSSR